MKNVRMLLVGVLALGFMVVRLGNASSLDDEALTHAKKIVGQFVTQCGQDGQDHYILIRFYDTGVGELREVYEKLQEAYRKGVGKLRGEEVIQIHGLRVGVKPENLSTADKLNGIEWSGRLLINTEATRSSHSAPFSALLTPFSKSPASRAERELYTDPFMPYNSLLLHCFLLHHHFLQAARPIFAPPR